MSEKDESSHSDGILHSEFANIVREHHNEYIKLADSKASVLLSAQIAYLAIFGNLVGNSWGSESVIFKFMSILTIVFVVIAIVFATRAVYPNEPETDLGLIHWKSIISRSSDEYRDDVRNTTQEEFVDELVDESYQLAKVTDEKYRNIRKTMWATGVVVVSTLITGAILLFPIDSIGALW